MVACLGDINPPALVSHLPQLVASCNVSCLSTPSSDGRRQVWLVPFAKGAEESLAEALGLRRASVLVLKVCYPHHIFIFFTLNLSKSTAPGFTDLLPLLASISILLPPWAQPKGALFNITPTHIKQLRTTAPKNIKEARKQKTEAKNLAKSRKKGRHSICSTKKPSIPPKSIIALGP